VKLARVSILVICVATALAGCGGGEGDDTTISKAEFVKRADAICAQALDRAGAAFRADLKGRSDPYTDEKELQAVTMGVLLPHIARMADELNDLGELVAEGDQADAIAQKFHEAVDESEADRSKLMAAGVSPFAEAQKAARAFGLKGCSNIY
jgi:hypothetical protein